MSKWLVIALIVVAVLLLLGLIWAMTQRKKDQQARLRADELRSEAADHATNHREQEAQAREAEARAQQARAQADQLEARAGDERRGFEMTQAEHEHKLREADRLDPDIDHKNADYAPRAHPTQDDAAPHETHRSPSEGHRGTSHDTVPQRESERRTETPAHTDNGDRLN